MIILNKLVSGVFVAIGAMVIASLLYVLLFVGEDCAMRTACRGIDGAMAEAYYTRVQVPTALQKKGVAESLGVQVNEKTTDLNYFNRDNSSIRADYSTGWK